MFKNKRWSSIRWRIVLIYFLLVFIAMTIAGVFIMSQLEAYMMNSVEDNFTTIAKENILFLQSYDNLEENKEAIQEDLMAWSKSLQEEMFVVDADCLVIASSNLNYIGRNGIDILGESLLVQGLSGMEIQSDEVLASGIPVKNMLFPIRNGDKILGVFCIRADISDVYDTQNQSQTIFIRAMLLALLITVVLGFFVARSITVPINDVTEKAERMAQGDFSQEVSVKSDDEIGRLAEMFNALRGKLDFTLSEISNEKNKLETILKYMADGLLAVDLSGRVILANPVAAKMLSMTIEAIESRSYDEIIGKYSKKLSFENMKEACREGGAQDIFEYGNLTFAARFDRFRDDNNDDIGIIMILQDITEQQKLEDMQRDFVANVSHELKTPLTTIKSYTETLLETDIQDRETVVNFLNIVDTEADRMNRLVKELLQLSRLDYQQEKWYMKDSNLISLLKSCMTKIELMVKNKNQELISLFDEDQEIMTVMDKDGIEQVLLNVLTNAIKYTPEGRRILVDAYQKDRQAYVVIEDNGIGIPEEELPRVFERFYRVDKARSREMGGTGLGLAIAKQIMEDHRGGIEIESLGGKGTKVTIRLPLVPIRGKRNIE